MAKWVDGCYRISKDELTTVMKMLDTMCPACIVKRCDVNEIELNVDLITPKAFWKVNDFVSNILISPTTTNSN
jgi:hypothetical protein